MAGIWSTDQADALLKAGLITPDQHQRNLAMQSADAGGGFPNLASMAPAGPGAMTPINNDVPIGPPLPPGGVLEARPQSFKPSAPTGADGLPPGVTASGGISLAPKPQSAPSLGNNSPRFSPGPFGNDASPALVDPDVPRMQRPAKPSEDDVRKNNGLRPLTPMMRRDPELKRRIDEDSAERKGIDDAQQKQISAEERKAEIAAQKADDVYVEKLAQNTALDARQKQHEEERAKENAEADTYLKGVRDEADALAKEKIDRNHVFADQTSGDYTLSVLTAMFSGFGAGYSGRGGNPYLERLDKMIDRDIDVQKANLANKRAVVETKRGIYGDMLKLYGNHEAARHATEAAMADQLARKVDTIGARYGSDEAKAAGEQAVAQLTEKAEAGRYQANQIIKQRLDSQRAAAAAAAAAQAKVDSERRWELTKDGVKAAHQALETATKEGTAPPPWALKALGMTTDDVTMPNTGGQGVEDLPPGLTKEQRGKIIAERHEKNNEAKETNAQFDRLVQHPGVRVSSAGDSAIKGALGDALTQRLAPEAAKNTQDVDELNTQLVQQLGKVSKDADGKPTAATLKMFHDRFEIHPYDKPEIRAQKVEGVRNIVNGLLRAQGATEAPIPNQPSEGKDTTKKLAPPPGFK